MRHRLSNGLTVLVEENHAAPVAGLQIWVRVGSADELPGEAGLIDPLVGASHPNPDLEGHDRGGVVLLDQQGQPVGERMSHRI